MTEVNIDYKFKIDTVGFKNVDGFVGAVCEIRYFFVGVINSKEKERFYVQAFDTSKLSKETFKPLPELTKDDLIKWLESSIDPTNLSHMKQAIREQFYPPVTYLNLDYFKDSSGS